MSMRQVNDLSKLYVEAVYGGVKKKEEPKDNRLVVTNADKKANTPAYQKFKAGSKAYKAADHMKEGHSADTKGKKNCGCGQDPCVTYGKQVKEEKKAAKDYDGDGKIESGKDEYFGSKDKAIKKAMGKKVKQEGYSNWRDELVEDNLIEVIDSNEEDENYGAKKKIDVKKGIKNKVNINPNLPEAVQEMGAELIEVKVEKKKGKAEFSSKAKGHDCASKVKHESYGVGDCIKEQHDLDENGNVTHYDVKFSNRIVRNVPASTLEVLEGMYHEHAIREGVYEKQKTTEVMGALKKRDLKNDVKKKIAADIVKKKGDTSKSDDRYAYEGYQRNPEADPRSARQKRMDDPDKGINSPAFRKFMADKDRGSSAKKSAPTKSKPNPQGTLNLSPEERKKREAKRREDLYKRSADMRRDHKKRGIGVYAKGAKNPGADMDKKLGI